MLPSGLLFGPFADGVWTWASRKSFDDPRPDGFDCVFVFHYAMSEKLFSLAGIDVSK
jgi:hypothetical protein